VCACVCVHVCVHVCVCVRMCTERGRENLAPLSIVPIRDKVIELDQGGVETPLRQRQYHICAFANFPSTRPTPRQQRVRLLIRLAAVISSVACERFSCALHVALDAICFDHEIQAAGVSRRSCRGWQMRTHNVRSLRISILQRVGCKMLVTRGSV